MKVKVVVSDSVIRDVGLGGLIISGQVLEVTNKCIDKLPNGMTYTYYEFSAEVLGICPTNEHLELKKIWLRYYEHW